MPTLHRLDQILARHGYCSRSEARRVVRTGRVLVNGEWPKAHDAKVDIAAVRVDGEPVEHPEGILVLLHKPAGFVCSHEARDGRPVYELVPERWLRRNPPVTSVGRLDVLSGALSPGRSGPVGAQSGCRSTSRGGNRVQETC